MLINGVGAREGVHNALGPVDYRTRVPAVVVLDGGEVVEVDASDLRLFVPCSVEEVRGHLTAGGFADALSLPKGEEYSMSKELAPPWELHVRLYRVDGGALLEGEVEVRRAFLEHLSSGARTSVIYEVISAVRGLCSEPLLQHGPSGKWVAAVLSDREVVLRPPSLTKWSTLALAVLSLALAGLLGLSLFRPRRLAAL